MSEAIIIFSSILLIPLLIIACVEWRDYKSRERARKLARWNETMGVIESASEHLKYLPGQLWYFDPETFLVIEKPKTFNPATLCMDRGER